MSEKKIGIIGAGAVGLSTAVYLTQKGHNVTVYKRDSENFNSFKKKAEKKGIIIKEQQNTQCGFEKINTQIKITRDLAKLKTSEILLLSISYQSHNPKIGQTISSIGLNNGIPIIIHPGKFHSSKNCDIQSNLTTETNSSIFGVTLKNDRDIVLGIKNRKSGLYLSSPKNNSNSINIVELMNNLFGKDLKGNYTFKGELNEDEMALANNDYSINTAAICDNIEEIIEKGSIYKSIYALSEEYSKKFLEIYNERLQVAKKLGLEIPSLQEWINISTDTTLSIYQLLKKKYGGNKFKTTINKHDRRFIEDPLALQRFIQFADKNKIQTPISEELLNILKENKQHLEYLPIFNLNFS